MKLRVHGRGTQESDFQLVEYTEGITAKEVSSKINATLYIRLSNGTDRPLGDEEKPFTIQKEALENIGYSCDDIDTESAEDHSYLFRFHAGKPTIENTSGSNGGHFLIKGTLLKEGKSLIKKWNAFYCVVQQRNFSFYKSQSDKDPKGTISIASAIIEDAPKHRNAFSIRSAGITHIFSADTKQEQQRWMKTLRDASTKDELVLDLSGLNLHDSLPEIQSPTPTSLNLARNCLSEVALSSLSSLSGLTVLSLTSNHFTEFPLCVCELESLTVVDVGQNRLTSLPGSLNKLTKLRVLVLQSNCISSLPSEISSLPIEVLVYSFNGLKEFPLMSTKLEKIKTLNLAGNLIGEIPADIGSVVTLEELDLRHNKLVGPLSPHIENLTALRYIDVSNNELTDVESIRNLNALETCKCSLNNTIGSELIMQSETLKEFHFQSNILKSIRFASSPHFLVNINVSDNRLTELPDSICDLEALETLIAKNNMIEFLPANIFNMKSLKWLFVGYNRLTKLPDKIKSTCPVQIMEVQNCRLRNLPRKLANMILLRVLNASHNELHGLPGVVPEVNIIQELYLAENQLKNTCVDVLSRMTKLRILHLGYNRISVVAPSIMNLNNLEELHLVGNQLTELPEELGKIQTLQHLFAGNNQIVALPAGLLSCKALSILDVSSNRLKELPERLVAEFPSLFTLNVSGNHSLSPTGLNDVPDYLAENVAGAPSTLMNGKYRYGSADIQGRRPRQEDSRLIVNDIDGHGSLACVFDGHAGPNVSALIKERFEDVLVKELKDSKDVGQALSKTFLRVNSLLKEGDLGHRCGSTATAVLLGNDGVITMANVGDTEAIICRDGQPCVLTDVHHLADIAEYERVVSLGGFEASGNRVNGVLAATRALGDFYMQPLVSPKPSIRSVTMQPEDEFLILACDGLWDVISHQQAIDAIRGVPNSTAAASKLRDLAYVYGSEDNISIVVVRFTDDDKEVEFMPRDVATVDDDDEESEPEQESEEVQELKEFQFVRTLGVGAFGRVLGVKKTTSNDKVYAIKVIDKARSSESDINAEKRMVDLKHPCLVEVYEVYESSESVFVVMEFMAGGQFDVPGSPKEAFSNKRVQFYAAQLIEGFHFLHSKGLVYRDMSLKNLLTDAAGNIKISDFGLASVHGTEFCGTPAFMAPEMVRKEPYDKAVDWWGLGVTLFMMLVGRPPFYADTTAELHDQINNRDIYYPHSLKSDAKKFLKGLLDRSPATRLGSTDPDENDVRKHSFVKGIYDKIVSGKLKAPYAPRISPITPDGSSFNGWR